jgi:hypothetical protein
VNSDIKQRWVAALRSGKYLQGQNFLRADGKYCCLGVLCDLYPNSKNLWYEIGLGYMFDIYVAMIPEYVAEWAGLDGVDPVVELPNIDTTTLSYVNDELMYDFNAIADIIEEQL